jgi:hypothetical protein
MRFHYAMLLVVLAVGLQVGWSLATGKTYPFRVVTVFRSENPGLYWTWIGIMLGLGIGIIVAIGFSD